MQETHTEWMTTGCPLESKSPGKDGAGATGTLYLVAHFSRNYKWMLGSENEGDSSPASSDSPRKEEQEADAGSSGS